MQRFWIAIIIIYWIDQVCQRQKVVYVPQPEHALWDRLADYELGLWLLERNRRSGGTPESCCSTKTYGANRPIWEDSILILKIPLWWLGLRLPNSLQFEIAAPSFAGQKRSKKYIIIGQIAEQMGGNWFPLGSPSSPIPIWQLFRGLGSSLSFLEVI